MSEHTNCPCCGSPVLIVTEDEGTSYYLSATTPPEVIEAWGRYRHKDYYNETFERYDHGQQSDDIRTIDRHIRGDRYE